MNAPRTLTYCTNIYPGETWADVRRNLEDHALDVKKVFSPDHSFPLGLRLSAQAAGELDTHECLRFRQWCGEHGCHVATLNGFPYGAFHGVAVKERVYLPDWRSPLRVSYTTRLADILAQILPSANTSSISTVPIAYKDGFKTVHWPLVRAHLMETLTYFATLHDKGGPLIRLALEPEPHCVLEQTQEVLDFFAQMKFPASLADYIGICLDCCHQAVQFEDPRECLTQLTQAGIRLVKIQVSSALRAQGQDIPNLLQFNEPTYLHQAVLRTLDGQLLRFADLPDLAQWLARGEPADECRVHFHVPIFLPRVAACGTTRFFLEEILPRVDANIPLEVETYSFSVVPNDLCLGSRGESITRELTWVKDLLNAAHRRY